MSLTPQSSGAVDLSRRGFIAATGALAVSGIASEGSAAPAAAPGKAKVYFSREISAASLRRLYALVNGGLTGKIAVKVHTGEPGGPNILSRDLVKALMEDIPGGTIVECNVAYGGPRSTNEGHRKTIETNGWTFCPVDILDEEGDVPLPIPGGKQLKEVAVGKHLLDYDSMLVLTHFKGHPMGGFGGSLKNIAIGCASGKLGKKQLHSEGDKLWSGGPRFIERMVEGGQAITSRFGERITYINVMNRLSVDCDCMGVRAAEPTAPDIGIVASTDILAVDKASVDMVYGLSEAHRHALVERFESRSGLHQLEYMKELGMGTDSYELIAV
ncbi:MAG: DUF362 domain-containing protein [Methylobacteriaceae bacterium]|jgi:uncharacterized Fe-S center protein|nr:DUF362 domain-containing protein [Methylobacteriaceae bacterium]